MIGKSDAPGAQRVRTRCSLLAVGVASALALSACGTAGSGSAGGDSSSTVQITVLADKTGPAAFFGTAVAKAAQFSADYYNAHGGMNGHKVSVDIQDTGSQTSTASSLMNKAVAGGADAVVFGVLTEEALAIGPLAQQAHVPLVNVQSGGAGVTAPGDYVWRITPQQAVFYPEYAKYLANVKHVHSAAVFYDTDNAVGKELVNGVLPKTFKDAGIRITKTVASTVSETDLTNAVSQLTQSHPDFIQTLGVGSQNLTLISQLRRAGYTGLIGGATPLAGGALASLPPSQSNGTLYYASFVGSNKLSYKSGRDFTAAFEKATGKQPNTFDAETYDAFGLIAQAIKASGDASPEGIKAGMEKVAANGGFAAAQADPLTFKDRDAQAPGAVVEWRNGKEFLAPGQ